MQAPAAPIAPPPISRTITLAEGMTVKDLADKLDVRVKDVLADPGSLSSYAQHVGKTLRFRVTGAVQGNLWGSDIYTTDSALAKAAVNAGIVKPGQSGIVKVTILPAQNAFAGTTRNGVTSSEYGQYPSAFQVHRKRTE